MSMHLPCGTMYIKMILALTLSFGVQRIYHITEEQNSSLLYMYTNLDEMTPFSRKYIFQLCTYLVIMIHSYSPIYVFMLCNSEFNAQTWRSNRQYTQKQLDNMQWSGI
jgi:hypothetical protein